MRIFLKPTSILILAVMATVFTSCQNEEPFEMETDPEQTLAATSTVVDMLKRITSSDGSYDNIVDGASCIGIQFPYSLTVNGTELTIASMDDLQKIEEILDAAEDGVENTKIVFPIEVTLADYSEIVINSEEMFRDQIEKCIEGGDDPDIECIDVIYPLNLFTFNPNLEQTSNLTVEHDQELRRFLAGLATTDLISIEFPMGFQTFDSILLTVNTNSELAAAMESALESCDEDDDADWQDDDFTKESLDSLLVTCPWKVNRRLIEQNDSEEFQEYFLTFSEDGSVVSDDGFSPVSEGKWSVEVTDFKVFLSMEFQDAPELEGTRYTYNIGEGIIKGEGDENEELVLVQACGLQATACSKEFIEETLQTDCRWQITDDEGEFFEALTLDFLNKNILVYGAENGVEDQGSWTITETTITFNSLNQSLESYNGDWQVIACSEERFRLQRGEEVVVLRSLCSGEY